MKRTPLFLIVLTPMMAYSMYTYPGFYVTILAKIFDGDILPEKLFKWLLLRLNDASGEVKATFCEEEESCLHVMDFVVDVRNRSLPIVYRALMISITQGAYHSAIELGTKELSFNALRTENWTANHSQFISEFNQGIIKIFPVNNVVSKTKPSRMLFTGLGGGSYPANFKENYPTVNQTSVDINPVMHHISTKWLGITESDLLRIEIADGAHYLKKLTEEGIHYDGIILDATYNVLDRDVVSPVDVFRAEDMVANIGIVPGQNGMAAINMLPGKGRDPKVLDPDHDLLKKHFKYVDSKKLNIFNSVTICSQRHVSFDNLVIEPMALQL